MIFPPITPLKGETGWRGEGAIRNSSLVACRERRSGEADISDNLLRLNRQESTSGKIACLTHTASFTLGRVAKVILWFGRFEMPLVTDENVGKDDTLV